MNISKTRNVILSELALIAVTRGAIGFGAGLLLAGKFKREWRKRLGWSPRTRTAGDDYPFRAIDYRGCRSFTGERPHG